MLPSVLLEEIGHAVDARLNDSDSLGDEGAIFSALVQGKTLESQELALLKAEDDTATIILDGKAVEIEQNTEQTCLSLDGADDQVKFLKVEIAKLVRNVGNVYQPRDDKYNQTNRFDIDTIASVFEVLFPNFVVVEYIQQY